MRSLRLRHALPNRLSLRILNHVIDFRTHYEDDVVGQYGQENFVAGAVERFVVFAVNLRLMFLD